MQLLNFAVICFLSGYVNVLVSADLQRRAANDLCSLPAVTGPCRAAFPSWFYNSTSQRCESFTYGGCGGNANRFETKNLCEGACQCDKCTLQRDPGPCRAYIPSYFYNVSSRKCEKFIYGGCKGNDNRFSSEAECTAQCSGRAIVRPQQPTTAPPQSRRCSIEGQVYTSCGTACPPTCSKPDSLLCILVCVPGCQCSRGTVLDEDNKRCVKPQFCPRPDQTCDKCSLQPVTGLCRAYIPSYYWNIVTRKCERFIYGGCGGNDNRFSTIKKCETACKQTCDIKGQEFTSCGTACPPTCSNPDPGICTKQCVIGCQCPRGTVLDEKQNKCVRKDQCSKKNNSTCEIEGQEFTSCGTACPPTCSNPDPGICTLQCVIGCQCPRGTVLDEMQNKCVTEDQCKCPPTCSHDYCSVRRNRGRPCSRPPPLTIPACPDRCQTTQCNACYYSMNSLETPSRCDRRACRGSRFTRCLRNWASCVDWANRQQNKCSGDCITATNFRCYDYPPCENLKG